MTIATRYGAQRQQFGPAEGREIAVLDYSSQQLKLMPMLATCYALHFTAAFLVNQYAEAKRTKEEELIADVHSLSAGMLVPTSLLWCALLGHQQFADKAVLTGSCYIGIQLTVTHNAECII